MLVKMAMLAAESWAWLAHALVEAEKSSAWAEAWWVRAEKEKAKVNLESLAKWKQIHLKRRSALFNAIRLFETAMMLCFQQQNIIPTDAAKLNFRFPSSRTRKFWYLKAIRQINTEEYVLVLGRWRSLMRRMLNWWSTNRFCSCVSPFAPVCMARESAWHMCTRRSLAHQFMCTILRLIYREWPDISKRETIRQTPASTPLTQANYWRCKRLAPVSMRVTVQRAERHRPLDGDTYVWLW